MRKGLVYILEDELEMIQILEKRFEKYGLEVKCFTDPHQSIQEVIDKAPDLMVVDIHFDGSLNGFDVIAKIRTELKLEFPIIILSGEQDHSEIAHGLEVGANEYLIKPPQKNEFEEVISRYLKAENLKNSDHNLFLPTNSFFKESKLTFKVSIKEIHPAGITLSSDHLINKGAVFKLGGLELAKITPNCNHVLVRVIGTAIGTVLDKNKFLIYLEIDESQNAALTDIKKFLDSKHIQTTIKN